LNVKWQKLHYVYGQCVKIESFAKYFLFYSLSYSNWQYHMAGLCCLQSNVCVYRNIAW